MTSRLKARVRFSTSDIQPLSTERLGRSKRGLSVGVELTQDNSIAYQLENEQLLQEIDNIKEENAKKHLENLIFARYLRRVDISQLVETFEQYSIENDSIQKEISVKSNRYINLNKLPKVIRRLSMRRKSADVTRSLRLWNKLLSSWRDTMNTSRLLLVEQEKLSFAEYEVEQTQLDWQRMKSNAVLTLDQLEVQLRAAESDIIAEELLQRDLEKHMNQFQININKDKIRRSHFISIPGEVLISRINKRIEKSKRVINYLNIDNECKQSRIRMIDLSLRDIDDFYEKTNEIDINFVRMKKIDYLDSYKQIDRQYKINKSSQYPLLRDLQDWKIKLIEQENLTVDVQYKCELLDNYLKVMNHEIDSINKENVLILRENTFSRNRMSDVKQAPSIIDYARIFQETKRLQDEIDVWTHKVNVAENLLSQLKRQTRSPKVLPPL